MCEAGEALRVMKELQKPNSVLDILEGSLLFGFVGYAFFLTSFHICSTLVFEIVILQVLRELCNFFLIMYIIYIFCCRHHKTIQTII